MKRLIMGSIMSILILSALLVQPVQAQSLQEKMVLIIHPFTPIYSAHQQFNQGIIDKLNSSTEYKLNYSFEYLDYPRFSHDEEYFDNIAQYLKAKYKKHPPDFIVTQANVRKLLDTYGQDIFPNVPAIIVQDRVGVPKEDGYFDYFFIQQATDIESNIELILGIMPKTKKIYMIIGDSVDERTFTVRLREASQKYMSKAEFVITNNMTYEQMMSTVKGAEGNSVILYFRWLTDSNGNSFVPEQVADEICRIAEVPVYGVDINYMGHGMVGGYVRDQKIAGDSAADIILEILVNNDTEKLQRIHAIKNNSVFDWRLLRKWNIDENILPKNSKIEFREISLWEKYKVYILGGLALFILETLLIFGLLLNRRQKRKAERQLLETNDNLQRLSEKLIDQDKMKDEFLITTSHELQTPLNGIINIAEGLAERNNGTISKEQQEELQVLLAVSKRMSSIIKDIIDLERIKRNEIEIRLEAIDLKAMLSMTVDVFRHLINNSRIEIILDIPMLLSAVLADRNRLIQVLYNVLGNSVKFTQKGIITIKAEEDADYVRITIEDTGIGMSKDLQERLFHVFEQGESAIRQQYGGSGLGLYITKNLLERMSGEINLEWSELGVGTIFSILIPRTDVKPSEMNANSDVLYVLKEDFEEDYEKLPQKFVILAVDDENTNLRVLSSIFGRQGYKVHLASTGEEAIDILQQRRDIDLVLLDVMMPGMSGYETCKLIRKTYSLYDLPILMLTVRSAPEDLSTGFEAGANDFVIKPFVAKELRARVNTLLLMKRSVNDALKNEMAFLQAQIKPHFLYNALSTIMSFCYTDGEKAGKLLANLSEYLQKSFNIDNTVSTVSLESELELIRAYVAIEKARFGERLTVVYHVDENLKEQRVLPLTIQPLVENAIRHGLMSRISGGNVIIEILREENWINISIQDDGVGMEAPETILNSGDTSKRYFNGVGLANIKRRIMNYYGSELMINSQKNKGTRVYFSIPVQDIQKEGD